MIQASSPGVAMPPPMMAGGTGSATTVSQARPSVLQADVAVHEEFGGYDVQLLGDIFIDIDQIATALFALARLRLMAVFDA